MVRKLLEPAVHCALRLEPPSCTVLPWYGLLWVEEHGVTERDENVAMGFGNTWLNCWAT